ncbi:SusD/RagB family nutrient-binding outer membrane lipoprotein [Joostella atrarenae]|uniref:SusD/RagB family nutrient-binding outer membrane lipoprotein n=1 Tax=Joostella atrarenae TaxID=679257 RepID=A0ABS9J2L2_9FLAO|nr:SusD/RagB family nutrient-binding outer membrane lipoprotein [Joostella atrarenae]MCF8714650.1 SusD/RagB family nutrient-binding outer membrane lipoprotein [Joostella atrarenae]
MSKIIKYLVLSAVIFLSSCEKDLEEKFGNPDKQTDPDIELFFTGALQERHLFRTNYGSYYHQFRQLNKVTGIGLYPYHWSSSREWIVLDDWSGPSFYYDIFNKASVNWVKNLNAMQLVFNGLPEEEKAASEVYFYMADIVKAFVYQRSTDAYDDIPYEEASGAFQEIFYPRYDSQEVIYKDIIEKLGIAVGALKNVSLDASQQARLSSADILNGGDVSKWIKFANSLRLRMAIRLSVVDPTYSREVIQDLTNNNAEYVVNNEDVIGMEELVKTRLTAGGSGIFFPRAFQENGTDFWAPRFIMEDIFNYKQVVDETVDPRTFVIFQPASDGRYIPLPEMERSASLNYLNQYLDSQDAEDIINGNHEPTNNTWAADEQLLSKYNRVTYLNFDAKFPVFTASETYLLLAEAAVRFPGSVDVSAVDAYNKAIDLSIEYYYSLNNTNKSNSGTIPPLEEVNPDYYVTLDQAQANSFTQQRTAYFSSLGQDDQIEEIFYQKVAHLNIFNTYEVWSEARRLMKNHGMLLKPVEDKVEWLERLYYPPTEERDNPDNFSQVAGQNDNSTPVWWTGRK